MLRAFVVQFDAEVSIKERQLAGRAEHVWTGEVTHFTSLDELLRFIDDRIAGDRAVEATSKAEECQQ